MQYELGVRAQSMYLLHNDLLTLKISLREWLTHMMGEARDRSLVSTRRLGHTLYSQRAIKLREFTTLIRTANFAEAVCALTGAQVGTVLEERRRQLLDQEFQELGGPHPLEGEEVNLETGATRQHHATNKGKGRGKGRPAHNPTSGSSVDSALVYPDQMTTQLMGLSSPPRWPPIVASPEHAQIAAPEIPPAENSPPGVDENHTPPIPEA